MGFFSSDIAILGVVKVMKKKEKKILETKENSQPRKGPNAGSLSHMALLWITMGMIMSRIRAESLADNMESLPGLIKVNAGTLYAIDSYVQVTYSLESIISFTNAITLEIRNLKHIKERIS